MELFDALRERRSVRRFSPEPVSEADLARILEAGRMAPSWANTQCWELVVVRDPDRRKALQAAVGERNPAYVGLGEAPVVLVVCGRRGASGFKKGVATTRHGDWMLFDLGLFSGQLTLAAHALGYGTVHVGLFDHAAVEQTLGLLDGVAAVELLPLGRPAGEPPQVTPRRPVAEFVRSETWSASS